MKVLYIGGTGNISTSCTIAALNLGIDVCHFNRGTTGIPGPAGKRIATDVRVITGNIRDGESAEELLRQERFDCVVDWIAYTPDHIETDLKLFRDRTDLFIFISSASVYHKPPRHYVITESTPAYNPFWQYSQEKIRCERLLQREYEERGFPITIVRPSHTYSDGWFPTTFGSRDFTVPQRILDGKEIIIHGDGTSLWTITHSDDFAKAFVGLLGNPAAVGETFHITSDEAPTWNQIHKTIGLALGAEPKIVHMPSDFIAEKIPALGPGLIGDKQHSLVFDNGKIKRTVPGFVATIPFYEGMRRSVEWVTRHNRGEMDPKAEAQIEELLAAWRAR